MLKSKVHAKIFQVTYHSAFYLQPIVVAIEENPNFKQMQKLIEHLIEEANKKTQLDTISEFKRSCYADMRKDLALILKELRANGKLLRIYRSGQISITRETLEIKRIPV